MQVIVESSWKVLQGSLDKSVTVVFLDPETHDPIISTSPEASEKLVLVPPTEPVPCEITVIFQGRLCHVQSFYTLSTARICELYSRSTKTDRDYICTVKGWIPYENSCFSEEGGEVVSEAADTMTHRNGMPKRGLIEGDQDESVLSSVGSSTVALNPAIDVKSVYSSSDDSWVDVRLHGCFTDENARVSAPASDNGHVSLIGHDLAILEDQLVLGRPLSNANPKDTEVESDSRLDECLEDGVQFEEQLVQGSAQQDMFEAELELIEHNPWVAVTIRLLSLQDKALVEVDQMVFLAVAGPVPEAVSPRRSADQGDNSLFAMFVPSMLQMACGLSGSSKSIRNCESSSLSYRQEQDMTDRLPMETMSRSCEAPLGKMGKLPAGAEEIGEPSLQNAVTDEASVQPDSEDLAAHVCTHEACAASQAGSLLNLGGEDQKISQHYGFNGTESKKTVEIGENQQISQQSNLHRAESKRTVESGRDQGVSQETCFDGAEPKRAVEAGEQPSQSDSKSCNCKQFLGDFVGNDVVATFRAFSERFDRLESVCLRMESYLQRTFENLDQRIKHLELQRRRGSGEEADCVAVSLKQSSTSIKESNSEESEPSGMQDTYTSDLPPKGECKEEVSNSQTQSVEPGLSGEQVFDEAPIPILFDEVPIPTLFDVANSDSVEAEKLLKEVPSESQEVSRGPETMVGRTPMQNQKPRAFLDEAWASALSAFASSFAPVVSAENTTANRVDPQPSGSSDASISMSPVCETPREERSFTKAPSHCDMDANCEDSNLEAAKFEDGLVYEDCVEPLCDKQMLTGYAFPRGIPSEKPDDVVVGSFSKAAMSVPNNNIDLSGIKDMQSVASKAQREDMNIASMQGFSGPREEYSTVHTWPLLELLASSHSNSTSSRKQKDISPALRGFKTDLSPVFDSTLSETQDANFLSLGSKEEKPSKREESRISSHFDEKNQDHLYNLVVETLPEEVGPSLLVEALNASHGEENREEFFGTTSDLYPVDLITRDKEKLLDMFGVQNPESLNSSVFTYCEAEGASSFPDVLEDFLNFQDGRTCSEDSLCFSQDFDICPNELCDADEWSCAPNIFYLMDPELTDDEANIAVEEKIEMSDISDTDSTEDLPFWPAVQNKSAVVGGRIDQQQPTIVFPGFENLS